MRHVATAVRRSAVAMLTLLGALGTAPLWAQEVATVQWGFDGRVVPGEFNLLTVVVRNDGPVPVEDALVLTRSSGVGSVGARIVEPVYLAPGTRRLVQMHPFIASPHESWSLRWQSARLVEVRVPSLRPGPRAAVLFEPDEDVRPIAGTLRRFPAAWFPATVGGAAALSDAVLDHAPEWEAPRADAFLAWLRAGGTLHLLKSGARWPRFGGALAELDREGDATTFRVGNGVVHRYETTRAGARPGMLRYDTPPLEDDQPEKREELEAEAIAPLVLRRLQELVQPDHQWGLIALASIVFLVLVGPVHWRLSRRRLDWRGSIGLLVAIVAVFTWLFLVLGARGYDERARVLTVAWARPLGGGTFDVTQYTNVFVTTGGDYRFEPAGEQGLFSTVQLHEPVPGVIDNGRNASFTVDMPLFSSRSFVHRAPLQGPDVTATAGQWPEDEPWPRVVEVSGVPSVRRAWLVQGGRFLHLQVNGTQLVVGAPVALGDALQLEQLRQGVQPEIMNQQIRAGAGPMSPGRRVPLDDVAAAMMPAIAAERLHLLSIRGERAQDKRQRLSLLLLCEAPPSFRLRAEGFGDAEAQVIYHLDVSR